MRSYFAIMPGVQGPANFKWTTQPPLISINELWEAARKMHSGLVFRVRSDSAPGAAISAGDRIESCVGLIDSSSRWRACAALARMSLNSLRYPPLMQPCWEAFGLMMNKHPAAIMMGERQAASGAIRAAMDKIPDELGDQGHYESSVAAMMVRLVFCDNDVEAAHILPYETSFMVNINGSDSEQLNARSATTEVLASSVLLSEAFGRLCERGPEWLYAPLPVLQAVAGGRPQAEAPPSGEGDDEA